MRPSSRSWVALILLTVVALSQPMGEARAHGREPEANGVSFGPEGSGRIVLDTTRGVFLTHDGGMSWRYICRAATMVGDLEDPHFDWLGSSRIVGATGNGLVVADGEGCGWSLPVDAASGVRVAAIARDPVDGQWAHACTASSLEASRVISTDDQGASWTPTGDIVGAGPMLSIASSVAAPDTIYAAGDDEGGGQAPLHISIDGGESYLSRPIPLADGEAGARILAVDPTRAEHLLVRIVRDPTRPEVAERVLRSVNGGESWQEVMRMASVRAAVFSPDGGRAWLAGRRSAGAGSGDAGVDPSTGSYGLWESVDGAESFAHLVTDISVGCLGWHDGSVWLCGSELGDGFSLGQLGAGGEVVEVFRMSETTGPVECSDQEESGGCAAEQVDLLLDLGLMEWAGEPSKGDPGCSCRLTSAPIDAPWFSLLLVSAMALHRSTRRRSSLRPAGFRGAPDRS